MAVETGARAAAAAAMVGSKAVAMEAAVKVRHHHATPAVDEPY